LERYYHRNDDAYCKKNAHDVFCLVSFAAPLALTRLSVQVCKTKDSNQKLVIAFFLLK
jgi:hypothetical protein